MTTDLTPQRLLELFQESTKQEQRAELAVQWVEQTMASIRDRGSPVEVIVNELVKTGLAEVRSISLAIPPGHPVLQRTWSRGVSASAFLPNYLDVTNPVHIDSISSLTRDMWLSRELSDRKEALARCAPYLRTLSNLSPRAASLLRTTAWDVAAATEMDIETVVAATRITLHTYKGEDKIDLTTDRPVMNALLILLIRCDGYEDRGMSTLEAKATLATQPAVCARLLEFVQREPRFRTVPIHGPGGTTATLFESLVTWLPRYGDAINIAADMGMSYDAILADIVRATASTEATMPLEGIDIEVAAP